MSTFPFASSIKETFSEGIIISPKLKDSPPLKANPYPIFLILSKKSAVSGTLVSFNIFPMISLKFFFVKTSLKKPAFFGTTSLKRTLPTVVSIIEDFLVLCTVGFSTFMFIMAFKSTFFSLYAM